MKNNKVSAELLSFFKDNLNNLTNSEISLEYDENAPENYVCFYLEDIKVWSQFEPVVYRNIAKFKNVDDDEIKRCDKNFREVKSLKKLKYNINHYLLIYESDDFILGQISRIYPKQVLHSPKWQFIFSNEKFTEIKSEPNIEIDEHDSVLFFINKEYKLGFTKNRKEYEDIFDMDFQIKINALNTIENSKFKKYCEIDEVKNVVNKDFTVQRMLNNKVTKSAFDDFDIDNFRNIHDKVKDSYDLDFEFKDDKFILNKNDEKKSLRSIIKVIGYYYNYSLDGNSIIEGTPKNITKLESENKSNYL